MNSNTNTVKRITQVTLLGWSLIFGVAVTTSAQNPYSDRYYRDSLKRHQKEEKRELKLHQRLEREEFGKSAALRRHQKEEQRELKRHQKQEKRYSK